MGSVDITKEQQEAAARRAEVWRIVANIVVPILFVVLIPTAIVLGYIQHGNDADDRKAAANDRRITAVALWDRYDNDFAGCNRGNIVRAHLATTDSAVKSLNEILVPYLTTSAALRKAAKTNLAARQALTAAERIRDIAAAIEPIVPIDCETAIVKPTIPRPATQPKGT